MPPKLDDAGSNSTVKGRRFFFALALGAVGLWHSFSPSTAERVHKAVFTPDGRTGTEPLDNLLFSFACIGFCGLFDMCVARWFGQARYFALHVAVNAVNIFFTTDDFKTTLLSPRILEMHSCMADGTPCCNKLPLDLTVGITLWHSLAYALKPIDWVHHVPALAVCAIGVLFPWGPSLNAACFIYMGLPGGIDYLLLVFVYVGRDTNSRLCGLSLGCVCDPI